ncbi:MAG TPA: hypothetical protein VK922_01340 [Gemmatimonadaceae bacterium]|nr:hypothetical protein [Gemmatimonadaceae bacterium]
MIHFGLRAVAIAAIAFGAAACGGDDSTGPEPMGTIALLNESSVDIVSVYFTSCNDDGWGPNRLADSETLSSGQLKTWSVEPGCYDVRASTGAKSATWWDREVTAGGSLNLAAPIALADIAFGDEIGVVLTARKR